MSKLQNSYILFIFIISCISLSGFIRSTLAEEQFSVFNQNHTYTCPQDGVGSTGLFFPHNDGKSEMDLLSQGEVALKTRLDSLRRAKKSILIQALIFTADESGLKVAELLKVKKKQGLDVRIIVDAFSNLACRNQKMYFDLKQHGIEVEGYDFLYGAVWDDLSLKRYHDKIWVIDGENIEEGIGIIGGINIANEYFRTGPTADLKWRDQDIIVRGPIVKDLLTTFERNFAYLKNIRNTQPHLIRTDLTTRWINNSQESNLSSCSPWICSSKYGKLKFKYTLDANIIDSIAAIDRTSFKLDFKPAKLRLIQHRPRLNENYINQVYLDMIRESKQEIIISNAYFLPDDSIINALHEAAKRGVIIYILTNSQESNDVFGITSLARPLYYNWINFRETPNNSEHPISNQINIFEWIGPRAHEGTMHSKFAIFDRKAGIIGSYNLDSRSKDLNSEVVIAFENREKANELAEYFFKNDLEKSFRITLSSAIHFKDKSTCHDMCKCFNKCF